MSDDVERVRRALPSLERYIRSHANNTTDLSRHGGELRGDNPWHGSTSEHGNFAVDPSEGTWFCHRQSHKSGGGIFEFIAVDEGIVDCGKADDITTAFPEVLEVAAEKAGVDLDMDAQDKASARKRRKKREKVDAIHEAATAYYHQNLNASLPHPDGHTVTVREWMQEFYGLSGDTLDEAMVGFAPNDDTALLDAIDVPDTTVMEAGLAVDVADGIKDFFDGRIIFPYFERGSPRYFIGRKTPITPDETWEQGKYRKIPTGDTKQYVADIVDEPIYGRDEARSADTIIVTEGVTDVLAARQHGYTAIAPVTTSFKKSRMRDVAQLVRNKRVVVCMDEDAESQAGIQGALKTAEAIEKRTGPATEVQVARLPLEEGDLCDYLRRTGGEF